MSAYEDTDAARKAHCREKILFSSVMVKSSQRPIPGTISNIRHFARRTRERSTFERISSRPVSDEMSDLGKIRPPHVRNPARNLHRCEQQKFRLVIISDFFFNFDE